MEKRENPKMWISKSYTTFDFKLFSQEKLDFHFEIQFFQTLLDGEMAKTKVEVLEKIYNFPVETCFICIHLGSQIFVSKSSKSNVYLPFSYIEFWVE